VSDMPADRGRCLGEQHLLEPVLLSVPDIVPQLETL
jgi:hypothetical protein